MNRLLRLATMVLCAILPMMGCEQESSNGGNAPTIKLTAGKATSTTISFTITAEGASECAYLIYSDGELSAERILRDGIEVAGDGSTTTIQGLSPETTYLVVAAARNNSGTAMTTLTSMATTKANNDENTPVRPPQDPDARNLEIEKTMNGRWYSEDNYYVTLVATTGEHIILDFYTIPETMSSYLPYGNYTLNNTTNAYTVSTDSSLIDLNPENGYDDGYLFTEGTVSIDVQGGYYALYFHLTYTADDTPNIVEGFYNGLLSGATVPEGDNEGAKKLIEVHEVGATSFKFTIHAEAGQYWRCSVVDKRIYDQTASNPGAYVILHGFMLDGTRTFNWEDGKMCEDVPGLKMSVTSSTDYLILAALMDYSEGQENNLLGGVEVVQIRTEAQEAGTGTVDINIKEINANDIVFDCTLGDDVWCCYVAMMETVDLDEIKAGKYALAGYDSFEECMLSLIPGLSHDYMRQFIEPQVDYRWEHLKYGTSYTMCVKVEDMDKRVSYIELEPFTTK